MRMVSGLFTDLAKETIINIVGKFVKSPLCVRFYISARLRTWKGIVSWNEWGLRCHFLGLGKCVQDVLSERSKCW